MTKAEYAKLRSQEARYNKTFAQRLRRKVRSLPGGGGGGGSHQESRNWARFVSSGEVAEYPTMAEARRAFNRKFHNGFQSMQAGQTINDVQIAEAMAASGGNPYTRRLQSQPYIATVAPESKASTSTTAAPVAAPAPAPRSGSPRVGSPRVGSPLSPAQVSEENTILQDYLQAVDDQRALANEANEARYVEGKGELTDLRDRVMGRVDNFGIASRADIRQKYAEDFGNQQASLQSRALGNSSIVNTYRQRNAVNRNRELQRLSESVDDRASRYDQALSTNLVNFIEKRTDEAPSLESAMNIARQFGAANNGRGFNADQPTEPVAPAEPVAPTATAPALPASGGTVNPSAPVPGRMTDKTVPTPGFNNQSMIGSVGAMPIWVNQYAQRRGTPKRRGTAKNNKTTTTVPTPGFNNQSMMGSAVAMFGGMNQYAQRHAFLKRRQRKPPSFLRGSERWMRMARKLS